MNSVIGWVGGKRLLRKDTSECVPQGFNQTSSLKP